MTARTIQRHTPEALPVFEGWTIDVRLREFRRAEIGKSLEFVPFDSRRGKKLLARIKADKHQQLPSEF